MNKGEIIETLNSMTEKEIVVFVYRCICGLGAHQTADHRHVTRQAIYLHLNKIQEKCAQLEHHNEAIASLQELFSDYTLDGFFVPKDSKNDMLY